jgi:hypothetical protein
MGPPVSGPLIRPAEEPRSRGGLESEPFEDSLALRADQPLEEGPRFGGVSRSIDDNATI